MTGKADNQNLDLIKLARLVDRYRHAVKEAARTNSASAINDSRVLGEKVDEAVRAIFDEKQRQLF